MIVCTRAPERRADSPHSVHDAGITARPNPLRTIGRIDVRWAKMLHQGDLHQPEIESDAVHAVAQAGRPGTVIEDVTEVAAALAAEHLRA